MTFQNVRTGATGFAVNELRHVSFAVADTSQPLRALDGRVAFRLALERLRFSLKHVVEQLLRAVRAVNLADRLQQIERELVALALKQIVAALRKPINHLRSAHFLRPPPGIEVTIARERDAM